MKHFNPLLILICIIGFFTNTALGQLPDKAFWHLDSGDGLISDEVNCLFQDAQGFIWIVTDEGLQRYDGQELVTFRHSLYDTTSTSLPSRSIEAITEGEGGKIWMIGNSGPNRFLFSFDPKTGAFSKDPKAAERYLREDLTPILPEGENLWQFYPDGPMFNTAREQYFWEGPNKKIWISGPRMEPLLFDPKTQTTDTLSIPDPENPKLTLEGPKIFLWKDEAGNQWWYYLENVIRYNPRTKISKKYPTPIFIQSKLTLLHQKVLATDDGSFWIAGLNGLFIYNPTTDSFQRYTKNEFSQNTLSDNNITNIIQDNQGRIWMGTRIGGVNIWDPFRLNASNYQRIPNEPNSLSSNYLLNAYEKNTTGVWIGNSRKIIDFLSFEDQTFQSYQVPGPSGQGWIRNAFPGQANSFDSLFYISLNPIKIREGLDFMDIYFFDEKKEDFRLFENPALKEQLPEYTRLLPFTARNGDQYHIAYPGGFIRNNPKLKIGLIRRGLDGSIKKYLHDPDDPQNSLAFNYLNYIVESSKDSTLWIGTRNGLSHFDPKTETFRSWYPDPNDPNAISSPNVGAMGMLEDTYGNIWIPHTVTGGVTLIPADGITKDSIYFIRFNSSNSGLQSDGVSGVVEDRQSNVWISNNGGIAKYDRAAKTFIPYPIALGRKLSPSSGISIGKYTGNIYFGVTGQGLFYFNPSSIRPDTIPPRVYLTELYINNQLAPIRGMLGDTLAWETPLDATISFIKNLDLTYAQNDFSLTFTALNYTYSERTRYKFKLEGYDQDWIEATPGNTRATYTNIPHGEYTFRVLACNSEGVWNEEGAILFISIEGPWWATIWAYISYLLLLSALVWGIIQWRTHVLKRQREELRARVNEQTQELKESNEQLRLAKEQALASEAEAIKANEAKSNFLSFVSHELRTPLTSIIGFANLNKRRLEEKLFPLIPKTDKKVERTMQQVAQNEGIIVEEGQRLADLINNLLDLAKIESGKVEWNIKSISPNDLVARAEAASQGLFTDRSELSFVTEVAPNLPTFQGDFDRLLQVILNLISNAVKFTESGTVSLEVNQTAQSHLQFSVRDTGSGIPTEYQDKIFQRFQQVEDQQAGKPKGTGLGLSICKEIVEYHGGKIWVDSDVPSGKSEQSADNSRKTSKEAPADFSQKTSVEGSVFYFTLSVEDDSSDALKNG